MPDQYGEYRWNPRNPHNSYYYKPIDQAAPIYVPPSHSTQRILPVPQKSGQGTYDYGRPGEASPIYIPAHGEDQPKSSSRAAQEYEDQKEAKMKPKNGGGMMAMSDRHSKEEIQRLSSKNDALTAALDKAHSAHGEESNLPATEYPRLPSHTSFAPLPASPQAQQVAAQNQQMMAPPPPQATPQGQQAMQPNPEQSNFGRSQNPAFQFNPNQGMPDMSALDEAYRRMGGVPQT